MNFLNFHPVGETHNNMAKFKEMKIFYEFQGSFEIEQEMRINEVFVEVCLNEIVFQFGLASNFFKNHILFFLSDSTSSFFFPQLDLLSLIYYGFFGYH